MQQPSQSPPGCNPYAVNNKGIAHLLLILLLVAGLSVVGMFLFKMVNGGGLNVMGAKIAINETTCQLGNTNVTCTGFRRRKACTEYIPGRGVVIGSMCVPDNPLDNWGPWNYNNCSLLKPLSCPNGEARNDCVQHSTSTAGVKNTGWRCVVTSPPQGEGGWNHPGCKALVPGFLMSCTPGEEKKDDCRNERTVSGLPQVIHGYRCVPLTAPTGECVNGNRQFKCPQDYVMQSCRMNTCNYAGCSGVQCAKKTPSTVALPVIITPVPVPERAPAPATSCIPEWGKGAVSQQCCTGSNTSSIDSGYKNKFCYPAAAKACHDSTSCITASGISCCAGYNVSSCGNGAFKCLPTKPVGVTYDADGDSIPDVRDNDPDGNEQIGPAQTPISIAPANDGGSVGGTTPPPSNTCPTCITASGSFKTAEGKPVNGADVIVYLGNGSTAGTAKTDASGNYSLRFDKKGINFAIRSVSTSYKPAKSSYPECRGVAGVGYEDCWFKLQNMSGVDFVSTAPSVNANRKPPTAEIASLSDITPVPQDRKINTVIRVNAYGSKVGKVTLYANPAYSRIVSPENPRCSDAAMGFTPIYSTQGRWVKVGEAVYNASNAFTTGFVTITWDTGALPCTMADNRTDGVCTGSYFLGANIEDLGDMSEIGGKTPVNVLRCTSNPVGNACSPDNKYYQGLCGDTSYSRLDIVPSVSTDPVGSVVIAAKGTLVNGIGPKMDLYVKGTLVKSWYVTPTLTNYKYSHDSKIRLQPGDIKIGFSNDDYNPATKEDRNLFVNYMSLYGVKYETEHASTTAVGVWDSTTRACSKTPIARKTELLGCNGYFQYNTLEGIAAADVSVVASGPSYQGVGPKMDLYVNNKLVKTWYVTGSPQTYTYTAFSKVASVRVGFSNDAYEILKDPSGKIYSIGRDLTVDYVKVGSDIYQTEGPNVLAVGVWSSSTGACTKVATPTGSQRLSCNGYFEYPLAK